MNTSADLVIYATKNALSEKKKKSLDKRVVLLYGLEPDKLLALLL